MFFNFFPRYNCFYHRKIPILESHFNLSYCPLAKKFFTQNRIFTKFKYLYILSFTKIAKLLLFFLPLCWIFSINYTAKTFPLSRSYYCIYAFICLTCRDKIEFLSKLHKINQLLCKIK